MPALAGRRKAEWIDDDRSRGREDFRSKRIGAQGARCEPVHSHRHSFERMISDSDEGTAMPQGIAKIVRHRPKLILALVLAVLAMGHAVWDHYFNPDQSFWHKTVGHGMSIQEFVDGAKTFAKGLPKIIHPRP
jgi:hypothetical protein